MSEQRTAIEVKDLKKSFDGKEFVLKGVNLEIPVGYITVLIGFSGTGKSVLLKHFLGLEKPTSGSVEILGQPMETLNEREMTDFRKKFGVLFQGAALFDDMTTIENVSFPLIEHRSSLSPIEIRKIAEGKLRSVGLAEKDFNKIPAELSGGMIKRTGLARAIALDPEIILYDEPTTGLDPIMTEMVDNLIQDTHRLKEGVTSVVVTHDLSAAFRIGDYVAMLADGKVILFGTPEDFLDSEIALVQKFVAKGMKRPG